jgi:GNAT superfamily N-acetyltransferase
MINTIKATDSEFDMVISTRLEMLKVVNSLPENAVFSEDFINTTKEYFKSPYQTTVLSVDENEVIGCATICYITVMPTFDHPNGKRAHIMNVYTRSSYRKQGIAFRMMEMLIIEAKQKGISEISLDATESGRPLYKKCGFVSSEEGMVLTIKSH